MKSNLVYSVKSYVWSVPVVFKSCLTSFTEHVSGLQQSTILSSKRRFTLRCDIFYNIQYRIDIKKETKHECTCKMINSLQRNNFNV